MSCEILACGYNSFGVCVRDTSLCPHIVSKKLEESNKPIHHVGPNVLAAICKKYNKGYSKRVETENFIFVLSKDL